MLREEEQAELHRALEQIMAEERERSRDEAQARAAALRWSREADGRRPRRMR